MISLIEQENDMKTVYQVTGEVASACDDILVMYSDYRVPKAKRLILFHPRPRPAGCTNPPVCQDFTRVYLSHIHKCERV